MNASRMILSILLITTAAATGWAAPPTAEEAFPAAADPLVGSYEGRWSEGEDVDPTVGAYVIPLGGQRYRIRLVPKLHMRCPPHVEVEVKRDGGILEFEEGGYFGKVAGGRFVGGRGSGRVNFSMEKTAFQSPTLGAEPPEGAVVLFNGSDLESWKDAAGWEITEQDALMVTPDGEDLLSEKTFKDCTLHVEFRTPWMPKHRGQSRGNSGVFLQDTYEVQVLDSYGLEGYYNECGALYKVAAPKVNACAPPLQWQTYDIEYRAPRFNEDGSVKEYPRMTVRHNGILVHHEQEMPWITAWKEKDRLAPPPRQPGSIRLQAHNNYVQFRNIWVVDKRPASNE